MREKLIAFKPDFILYTKWDCPKELLPTIEILKRTGTKTICWLFDLYFNYQREYQVKNKSFFKSDYVFTTDGGQQNRFEELGINHKCVRQGIFRDECVLLPFQEIENEIIFVGSENPIYPERTKLIRDLNATWFGRKNTNELRGMALNELYAKSRVVIGDSFPSPHYWSNRVVETLGRGGFLIHKDTPGLKEAYPFLVTYKDKKDLLEKIEFYKNNESERRKIIRQNFEYVKNNYTMEKQCQILLNYIS
jgi:spore maturation protein CgeB